MDNKCVKYYPDPTLQGGVIARTRSSVYVHYDLAIDLEDMTFGQGYDTSLGHEQQLYELLSRSIMVMRSKREVPRGVRNSKVRRQDKYRRDWSRH